MLDVFRLIPAMQVIFTTEIEFDESSFAELNEQQYAAFERDHGKPTERMFQIVLMEPTAIVRTEEKVTLELSVVTESERQLLFEGVAFVYRASADLNESSPSFKDRLSWVWLLSTLACAAFVFSSWARITRRFECVCDLASGAK